jgi:hypothetical protein
MRGEKVRAGNRKRRQSQLTSYSLGYRPATFFYPRARTASFASSLRRNPTANVQATVSERFLACEPKKLHKGLLLVLFNGSGHRGSTVSVAMLILFVVIYDRFSKPINRIQTEAAKSGGRLDNARPVAGVLGPLTDDARSAAGRIHARPVRCIAVSSGWLFVM